MMIKIMNKLYPGKENYKKRNTVYRKVRNIKSVIKDIAVCSLVFMPYITIFFVIASRCCK